MSPYNETLFIKSEANQQWLVANGTCTNFATYAKLLTDDKGMDNESPQAIQPGLMKMLSGLFEVEIFVT